MSGEAGGQRVRRVGVPDVVEARERLGELELPAAPLERGVARECPQLGRRVAEKYASPEAGAPEAALGGHRARRLALEREDERVVGRTAGREQVPSHRGDVVDCERNIASAGA